jgi:Barstar (barnase inhibitor)
MLAKRFDFIFANEYPSLGGFLLRIPQGIADKAGLLEHYAKAGRFPGYFGKNWSALEDCLNDFSWVTAQKIVIRHDGIPLAEHPKDLHIYLDILDSAVKRWKSSGEIEMLVYFPVDCENYINQLATAT